MKSSMPKIISTILVFILSTLTFSSCSFGGGMNGNHTHSELYPEGYTCGFGLQPGSPLEYWWVETYEECINAIELLKSHGSTFSDHVTFSYDGDLFDTKYCFVFGGEKDKIKFGDNPFDRYAEKVIIDTYAFFDDVSIDEINHSYISHYEAYKFGAGTVYMYGYETITIDQLVIGDWEADGQKYYKKAYYNDSTAIVVRTCFYVRDTNRRESLKVTNEILEEMIISGIMIKISDVQGSNHE